MMRLRSQAVIISCEHPSERQVKKTSASFHRRNYNNAIAAVISLHKKINK